jgi:antitoxin VapB
MPKAKLFTNGGSQAVRLPAEFRFEGDDVDVRRDPVSGDVILSKPRGSWDEYFAWVATLDLPKDFMADRDQPVDDFRDPFARSGATSATKRG